MKDSLRPRCKAHFGGSSNAILLIVIVLIALNLRPFITAPGPILPLIVRDTGMSYGALSLLTLLPMLVMGVGAFVAPAVQVWIGNRRGLLLSLSGLALGSLLRSISPSAPVLIFSAALCGAAVAFVQSAIPGIIKERFPGNVAMTTGLYSSMIMAGGAIGAQLMPFLTGIGVGWPEAMGWLALPASIALVAAAVGLRQIHVFKQDRTLVAKLIRLPRTWTLILIFGLVNGGYSSLVAWLAPFYQVRGWSAAESGTLIVTMALCQAAGAIILPMFARGRTDRRPHFATSIALQAAGFGGLAYFPDVAALAWAGMCGAGLAGSFALSIVIALDHLPKPEEAGPLAAVMQGGGFLIASLPPFFLAIIHDGTGSFAGGWIMHLAFISTAAALCFRLDPRHYTREMRLLGEVV